jgi:hypothetical protein
MRKIVLFAIILSLLAFASFAYAQTEGVAVQGEKPQCILFQVNTPYYFVKGYLPASVKPEEVKNDIARVKMDVSPYVENGRTFVPVRYLSNALGVEDSNIGFCNRCGQGKVTLRQPGFPTVEMEVGVIGVLSDGVPVPGVDVAPALKQPGRTFLPARFVAEALGYRVEWLPERSLVLCWPKDKPRPTEEELKPVLEELSKLNGQEPPKPPVQQGDKWVMTSLGVYLPKPDNPEILNQECYNYTIENGICILGTPVMNDIQVLVPYREALEKSNSLGAYDELYQIIYGTFKDEKLSQEVTSYVRENKVKRQVEIPEKKWTVPGGWLIWVRDAGIDACVDLRKR